MPVIDLLLEQSGQLLRFILEFFFRLCLFRRVHEITALMRTCHFRRILVCPLFKLFRVLDWRSFEQSDIGCQFSCL